VLAGLVQLDLGIIDAARNDPSAATDAIERAQELLQLAEPLGYKSWAASALAWMQFKASRHPRDVAAFTSAMQASVLSEPDASAQDWFRCGEALYLAAGDDTQHTGEAERCLKKCTELPRPPAMAFAYLGALTTQSGKKAFQRAKNLYLKALSVDPGCELAGVQLCAMFEASDDAKKDLRQLAVCQRATQHAATAGWAWVILCRYV
jgi:tetratricopeptide (TPR) repeat protein